MSENSSSKSIAFALGGLAGNNAHGAGFLYAALAHGITPKAISCTSGQIRTTFHYLQARKDKHDKAQSFHNNFLADYQKGRPTGEANIDLGLLMLRGFPDVFRPAFETMLLDAMRNGSQAFVDMLSAQQKHPQFPLLADLATNWTTNHQLTPLTDEEKCEEIAHVFNAENGIEISFNAYDPIKGKEFVYLNHHAWEQRAARKARREAEEAKHPERKKWPSHEYRIEKKISGAAIRDALWLYSYGLNNKPNSRIDGAFFREIMLRELVCADLIIVVRPISVQYTGQTLPNTYQATEDLKIEVGFNGSYLIERERIDLVNELIAANAFNDDTVTRFRPIELEEICIRIPRGFYDYALEDYGVYEQAIKQAQTLFAQRFHKAGGRPLPTAPTSYRSV